MTHLIKREVLDEGHEGVRLYVWCPGCDDLHAASEQWDWNGDSDKVTLNPSLLVGGVQWARSDPFHKPRHQVAPGGSTVCHSFIVDGRWQFLADSTHALAGQTVDMVDIPEGARGIWP